MDKGIIGAEIVLAEYVSVWDDQDEVRTPCLWHVRKRIAFDIDISDEPDGANALTREYVQLDDGTEIDVDHDLETNEGIPAIVSVGSDQDFANGE